MDKLFNLLSNKDLLKKEKISIPHIEKMSRRSIIDLSEEILESTANPNIESKKSTLSHAASLGLGGGRDGGCMHLQCRLERIDHLARFSLIYSDKVYINNYFCDYAHRSDTELIRLRKMLYDDLYILKTVKPLIDRGYISVLTAPGNICPNCLSLKKFDKNIERRIKSEEKLLCKQIIETCSFNISKVDREYVIHMTGPEKFIEHGEMYKTITKRIVAESLRGITVKNEEFLLKKYQIKNIGIDELIAHNLIKNISYELASNQVLGTSFLTDREFHISMLMDITKDDKAKNKNMLASKHLTSILPFLDDLDIKKLMKLRDREEESFIRYRSVLNTAIREFKNTKGTFTETDAKSIYDDIIRPEIASLDQKVKLSKSDLMDSARRTAISTFGALTFGIYMGLNSSSIISMAGVMGFSQILKELMAVGDKEKIVRDDNLYFLWKAKRLRKTK